MSKPYRRKDLTEMSKNKKFFRIFKVLKFFVTVFYPKTKLVGTQNLPDEPVIIVGNHSQIHGPIACELFFPKNYYTWCAGQMMNIKEVPAYAYQDFWSQKPKGIRWIFKIISFLIAPLCVIIFKNARTIAVYKDKRIISTFKDSVKRLQEGNSIIIFPEHDKKYNNIIYDFQDGFVDLAKLYYKKVGKEVKFVPLYIAPELKTMYLGKPISFSATTPIEEERQRICDYLMKEITNIAVNLPEHTVVPYRNISKKLYPANTLKEE